MRISYTHYKFTYDEFRQVNNDFSGKTIPSVSPNTIAAELSIFSKPGLYLNATYYYCDKIYLNDANTEHAASYNLLGARLGWKKKIFQKNIFDIFTGFDNLLNEKYSLGNDINASGGRFYNAAPGLNFNIGITFQSF